MTDNTEVEPLRAMTWYVGGRKLPEELQGTFVKPEVKGIIEDALENADIEDYIPTTWEEAEQHFALYRGTPEWHKKRNERCVLILLMRVVGPGKVTMIIPDGQPSELELREGYRPMTFVFQADKVPPQIFNVEYMPKKLPKGEKPMLTVLHEPTRDGSVTYAACAMTYLKAPDEHEAAPTVDISNDPYVKLISKDETSDNADYSVVRLSHPPPTWYARGALVSEKVPEAQAQFQSAEMLDYVYTCLGNAGPDLYHPTNWEETERYLASARQSKDWRKLRQNRRVAVLLLDIIGRGEVSILMPETKRAIKLEKGMGMMILVAADMPPDVFSPNFKAKRLTRGEEPTIIVENKRRKNSRTNVFAACVMSYWAADGTLEPTVT